MFPSFLATANANHMSSVQPSTNIARQPLILQQGQILQGEVIRLLPGQQAVVQLNQHQVQARLQTSLVAGQRSWFQVTSTGDPITLQMVPTPPLTHNQPQDQQQHALLRHFGLAQTSANQQIVQYFVEHQLPMNRSVLHQVHSFVTQAQYPAQTLNAIQTILERGWPLTQEVVNSVRSFLFDPPLGQQMQQLSTLLSEPQFQQVQSYLPFISVADENKNQVLRAFLQQMGMGHEQTIQYQRQTHNFKQQLLQWSKDPQWSQQAKQVLEGMLHQVTGQQLFAQVDTNLSPMYQLLFQWPLQLENQLYHVYLHMQGKHEDKGQVNPDHCRLIFYVELQALGEMCVDISIMNKYVSIHIFNDADIERHISTFKPKMAESLQQLGYTLTSFMLKKPSSMIVEKQSQSPYTQHFFKQGVDIRI